ncbi:MerR family transcriptional regulator [Actinomadura rayongensis]|uniref:MerR family transcriptional regulator n=1 Tax=Actinomadura rayongensis TaxID=1429076 RepID=A0A6I4W2P1_9ACTN|nr:MerR family transcriptional regulator [Actinomadura rayongensis]
MTSYTPGETAEKSGFSLDTLRYYEKIGLLSGIARDTAGRRVFTDHDLSWLHMIRCLRETGMPLAEMVRYAELTRGGEGTVADRLELLRDHDRRVEAEIAKLRAQQRQIQWKITLYSGTLEGACSPKRTPPPAETPAKAPAGAQAGAPAGASAGTPAGASAGV